MRRAKRSLGATLGPVMDSHAFRATRRGTNSAPSWTSALAGLLALFSVNVAPADAQTSPPATSQSVCWINAATGVPVPTSQLLPEGAQFDDPEHNHASIPLGTLRPNFVRVPCPPTNATQIVDVPSAAQVGDVVRIRYTVPEQRDIAFSLDGRKLVPTEISADSATVTVPADIALGPHQFTLESGGKKSSTVVHVVKVSVDPLGTTEPGVEQTVTVHVEGLTPVDAGVMYFRTADPAKFVSGKPIESSPVVNGVARTQIVGIHEGRAIVQFKLVVSAAAK